MKKPARRALSFPHQPLEVRQQHGLGPGGTGPAAPRRPTLLGQHHRVLADGVGALFESRQRVLEAHEGMQRQLDRGAVEVPEESLDASHEVAARGRLRVGIGRGHGADYRSAGAART